MGKYNSVLSITESQFLRLEQLEFTDEELGRFLRLYRQAIMDGEIPPIKDRCLRAEVISAVQFRDYQVAKNEDARERKRKSRENLNVTDVTNVTTQNVTEDMSQKLDQIKVTVKEKVKETIKDTVSNSPSLTSIKNYIQAKKYSFAPERFYEYCERKGWQNIDDWKKYADTWQRMENPSKGKKKRISDTMSRDEQTIKGYMQDLNDPTA